MCGSRGFFVLPEGYYVELSFIIKRICEKNNAVSTFYGKNEGTIHDNISFSDFTVFIVNTSNIESCIKDALFAVEIRKRILLFVDTSIDTDSFPIQIKKQRSYLFSSTDQLKKILIDILPERIGYIRKPGPSDEFDKRIAEQTMPNEPPLQKNQDFNKINAPPKSAKTESKKKQLEELDGAGSPYISNDTWTNQDKLDRQVLAHSIFKFLTHKNTNAPLTISIQAPWGAGKTSLMKMIQQKLDNTGFEKNPEAPHRDIINLNLDEILDELDKSNPDVMKYDIKPNDKFTIWFNAWKYENSEQVWAGLADAIIRQITGRLDENDRTKFWIRINKEHLKKLNIRKTIKNKIFSDWIKKIAKWAVMVLAGAIASSVAFYLDHTTLGKAGLFVSFIAGGLTVYKEYSIASLEVKTDAVANTYEKYLKIPNYDDKLGLAHTVEQDIRDILRNLPKEHLPLAVFIDDLDRCSPPRVAAITEAINRFISASIKDCIFVIGMDNGMIAASIESAYPELSNKLMNQYADQTLGWKFMDKFIQLPITIPSPQSGTWVDYLESILEKKNANTQATNTTVTNTQATNTTVTNTQTTNTTAPSGFTQTGFTSSGFTTEDDMAADTILGDDEKIKQYCKELVNDFTNNPREIKRIVNVLRFQSVLRDLRMRKNIKSPTTQDLLAWTKLSLKWPAVESWITRGNWETSYDSEKNMDTRKISKRLQLLEKFAKDSSTWQQNLKKLLLIDDKKQS